VVFVSPLDRSDSVSYAQIGFSMGGFYSTGRFLTSSTIDLWIPLVWIRHLVLDEAKSFVSGRVFCSSNAVRWLRKSI